MVATPSSGLEHLSVLGWGLGEVQAVHAGEVIGELLLEGFVVTRVLHPILYIVDQDKLRSLSFIVGLVCLIALFVKAA